ncbi:MAG: DUF2953 domain-containing protein [Oscillospiraceae bacterium]|nr:DUF2953 domain-containing protein [Oscillospiraceae bacterium]
MIVLYIFLGILAFLGLVLFLPLHIHLHYSEEAGFRFCLKFAWIPLVDSSKEKKPSAPKHQEQQEKPKEEKEKKKDKKKDKKTKKKGSPVVSALFGFLGLEDIASVANMKRALDNKGLCTMLSDLGVAVGKIFQRIGRLLGRGVFHQFTLRVIVGDEDAADCAMNYGRICGLIYPTITMLDSAFTYRRRTVDLRCDFNAEKTEIFYEGLLRYRPWDFICFLGGLIINYLKRSVK